MEFTTLVIWIGLVSGVLSILGALIAITRYLSRHFDLGHLLGGLLRVVQTILILALLATLGVGVVVAVDRIPPLVATYFPSPNPTLTPAPTSTPSLSAPARLSSLDYVVHTKDHVDYILPPLRTIGAGSFLMGSDPARDPLAATNEQPQFRLALSAFQIAEFPVTVAEYAAFVRSGYGIPVGEGITWTEQLAHPDHPVVNISWYDATAYAVWLSKLTGQTWRLPTEAEWEKAARGTDGRIYPWGDTFDTSRANTFETGIGTTSSVGAYPAGASPYGVQDMAGNVSEWTSNLYALYPYAPKDGREDPNAKGFHVLRGGAWYSDSESARSAARLIYQPGDVNRNFGFRLVQGDSTSG